MRVVADQTVLQTYALQILGPGGAGTSLANPTVKLMPEFLREMEENYTDLLPPGFFVRIKEWDK